MKKCAQLLQGLFHLQAVIDHAPHHLDAGVGRRLLQAVVIQARLVAQIPQEPVYLLGHLLRLIVGTRNNNKRKESTRIREVCSSCQFFLAKQRYFYLARRVSKFRTNLSNTKVN